MLRDVCVTFMQSSPKVFGRCLGDKKVKSSHNEHPVENMSESLGKVSLDLRVYDLAVYAWL